MGTFSQLEKDVIDAGAKGRSPSVNVILDLYYSARDMNVGLTQAQDYIWFDELPNNFESVYLRPEYIRDEYEKD